MMAAGDQALPFVPGDHYNIPPVLVVRMLKASSRRSMAASRSGCLSSSWRMVVKRRCASAIWMAAWGFCPVLEACFSVAMNQS